METAVAKDKKRTKDDDKRERDREVAANEDYGYHHRARELMGDPLQGVSLGGMGANPPKR